MKTRPSEIPIDSLIQITLPQTKFNDCYSVFFQSDRKIDVEEAVHSFFSNMKVKWVDALFKLRNYLVKPFKLYTPENVVTTSNTNERITKGGKVAFFDVLEVRDEEILLFADDSHLKAWFSVFIDNSSILKRITFTTTVQTKNRFGKLYLAIINPFHKLIIKTMLKKVAQQYLN